MNISRLTTRNRVYFVRYYKLIVAAVVVMVTVLLGSLAIGDSVRGTLSRQAHQRLPDIETVVFTSSSFLNSDFAQDPVFNGGARGVLVSNGFVSLSQELIPVMIWGVDNEGIAQGGALLNDKLATQLAATQGGQIVLRLPSTGLVPSGSLFVTDNYSTSLRLDFAGVRSVEQGGNISLKNEQIIPCNIFVNRDELASAMQAEGKINMILSGEKIAKHAIESAWRPEMSGLRVIDNDDFWEVSSERIFIQKEVLASIVQRYPHSVPMFSYLVNQIAAQGGSIPYSFVTATTRYAGLPLGGSDVILSDYAAVRLGAKVGDTVKLIYFTSSDLKNLSSDSSVFVVRGVVPLAVFMADSTLSASFPGLSDVDNCTDWNSDMPIDMTMISKEDEDYWDKYKSTPKAIIGYDVVAPKWSNDYGEATAMRIYLGGGEAEYFDGGAQGYGGGAVDAALADVSSVKAVEAAGEVFTATALAVAGAPAATPAAEASGSAEAAASISATTSTATPAPATAVADAATAPKAAIAATPATALAVAGAPAATPALQIDLTALTPQMMGVQVVYPLEAAIKAARGGVDFSSLFLSLGFFILVAAMLLLSLPLSDMLAERSAEIALLSALGYTRKRIARVLWRESRQVVLISSLAGVATAVLYTMLVLWLLQGLWKGATHTDVFSLNISVFSVVVGIACSSLLSMVILWDTIRRYLRGGMRSVIPAANNLRRKRYIAALAVMLTLVIIIANIFYLNSVPLFMVSGVVIICAVMALGDYFVCSRGASSLLGGQVTELSRGRKKSAAEGKITLMASPFTPKILMVKSLYFRRRENMRSFLTLTIGIFTLFTVGLNRKGFSDSSQLRTASGGYTLWCENSVPIYHDLSSPQGREKLGLSDLPNYVEMVQMFRYGADDAGCLNLNRAVRPTVLGVDFETLKASDFDFQHTLESVSREELIELMQAKNGKFYPVVADETVLTWGLFKNVGDTMSYVGDNGQKVVLKFVGALKNSIFQGNVLMDRGLFTQIWSQVAGSEVMLVRSSEESTAQVKQLLTRALRDYGVRVSTTNDRLREFNSVTDTYLTVFMMLGGFGLLLGFAGFVIVVRKNLASRRAEIALFRSLGYSDLEIEKMLYRENIVVPLLCIAVGFLAAVVGVSGGLANVGVWIWVGAAIFGVLFALVVLFFVKESIRDLMRFK